MHRPVFALLILAIAACTDPAYSPIPAAATTGAELGAVTFEPSRKDGRVSPIVRLTVAISSSLPPEALATGRVVLIAGGASEADVAAYAKNRTTVALRNKEVPLTTWGAPASAATTLVVQPSRRLPVGKSTLLVLLERRAPWSYELDVGEHAGAIAARRFPIGTTTKAPRVTYCAPVLPALPASVPHPTGTVQVVQHAIAGSAPQASCFDLVGRNVIGMLVPPPAVGELLIDPQPIAIDPALPAPEDTPCPADVHSVSGLCVRVEDDRVVLLGDVTAQRLALGTIAGRGIVAPLDVGARVVVRGLTPSSSTAIDLLLRDVARDRRAQQLVRTRAARAHLVVNEILARPPSGSASQKFVELVNDSAEPLSLGGLFLRDGDDAIELPPEVLPPGGFALLTPERFVDGLAGEVPPPASVLRLYVDSLRLTGEVSVTDAEGVVLSRFPASSSTKTIARGRRTPEHPDDAADAFGWDRDGRATPGLANLLSP